MLLCSKILRATLAPALAVCFLVGPMAGQAASRFPDVTAQWEERAVQWAVDRSIVDGYEDGTFRPRQSVSEAEFLAMLVRAYPEAELLQGLAAARSGSWSDPYYQAAARLGWSVLGAARSGSGDFNRGQVARLLASTQGRQLAVPDAVQYLLDQGWSEGKTSATVEGYAAEDRLTRAEAVQFLKNAVERGLSLTASSSAEADTPLTVRGVALGDSEATVRAKLGEPARRDESRYGFDNYIYNQDLWNYTQVGIQDGRVVALYINGQDWTAPGSVNADSTSLEVAQAWGDTLSYILKGDTRYMEDSDDKAALYRIGNAYVRLYYDTFEAGRIDGIQIVAATIEEQLHSYYGKSSESLRQSYELESFELANAARVQRGLPAFEWNATVAEAARLHSRDMIERDYFEHVDPDGLDPADRLEEQGLHYSLAGENIAAGQTDAVAAHHAWMNSEGHRNNLMSEAEELGVGVAFGGEMSVYYTQNFFTPY